MSKVLPAPDHGKIGYTRDRLEINFFALVIFGALWSILVGMTLLGVSQAIISVATQFASLLCFGIMIKYPSTTLIGLPFFALLAPVGGFLKLAGLSAVVTDWLMVGIGFYVAVFYRGRVGKAEAGFTRGSIDKYLQLMILVYLISCLVGWGLGSLISLAPLYYLLVYFLIYYYYSRFSGTYANQQTVLDAWCLASVLGAAILLHAFWGGRVLVNFSTDDADITVDRFSIEYLFQATYYYAGFHFIIGMLSSGLMVRFIFSRESLRIKVLIILALMIFFTVMAVTINKTAIVAALMSFIVAYGMIAVRLGRINVLVVFLLPLVLLYFIYFLSDQFGSILYESSDQYIFSVTSASSFLVRLEVWTNALLELFRNPWFIPFGLGPNAIENGNQEISELFKISRATGGLEGALDSTWLTYLVEFGVFGFLLIIGIFYRCAVNLIYALRNMSEDQVVSPVFVMSFAGLVYLVFAFISQSLGYTKISWLPFQMLLIVSAYGSIAYSRN